MNFFKERNQIKQQRKEMEEFRVKLLNEGRFDDALRYAEFTNLMKKCTDIDWGTVLLSIALIFLIFALIIRVIIFALEIFNYNISI